MSRCKDPRGFIKLWRKSNNSSFYDKSLKHIGLFVVLLRDAAWKTGKRYHGEVMQPGQWGFTIKGLAIRFKEQPGVIRRMIQFFEDEGMIVTESRGNRWTKYTIVNWDEYQGDDEKNQEGVESPSGLEFRPALHCNIGKPAANQTANQRQTEDEKSANQRKTESVSGLEVLDMIAEASGKLSMEPRTESGKPMNTYEEVLRSKNKTKGDESPSLFPGMKTDGKIQSCPYEAIKDYWNELCKTSGLSRIQAMSKSRTDKLRKWWKEDWFRKSLKGIMQAWHDDEFRRENSKSAGTFDHFLAGKTSNNPLLYYEKMMASKYDKSKKKDRVMTTVRTKEGKLQHASFESEDEMNSILTSKGYVYHKSLYQWIPKEDMKGE